MSFRLRLVLFLLFSLFVVVGFLVAVPPFPQLLSYHNFADQRCLLCIPHALNVVSNLPFVIVGVWGLAFMACKRSRETGRFLRGAERGPYWVFFAGIALTGIGSA